MNNPYARITSEGRIVQNDNAYFKGRPMPSDPSCDTVEAMEYFSKLFSDLEKYVKASLMAAEKMERSDEWVQKLEVLKQEVTEADAVGDFDRLLGEIDAVLRGQNGESTDDEEIKKSSQRLKTEQDQKAVSILEPAKTSETGQVGNKVLEPQKAAEVKAEEDKPVSEKTSEAGPVGEEVPESQNDPVVEPEIISEKLVSFIKLSQQAQDLKSRTDWQQVLHEFDTIRYKWKELLDEDETLSDEPGYGYLLDLRNQAESAFSERKLDYLERRKEKKRRNLEKRMSLLEQLQQVIDKKKWQAFKEVAGITNRWEEIKDLPAEPETETQNKKFEELLQQFNEKKVAYLIKKAQKEEENLVGKLAILDKLTQITSSVGEETELWDELDAQVEELSRQWRKIGHVPLDQSDTIWEQFKTVRDDYFEKKFEFNQEFKKKTLKNIHKKTVICEQAEALLEEEDLAISVREMNGLHKRWKKVGPVPKDKNDELWDRFNEATLKFNELKNRNQDKIREQEQKNLEKKVSLCEKAEEWKDSTSWQEATRVLEELMKEWKLIGPVPRRKSGRLWKRFKDALDAFFESRRNHYRMIREEQKENYDQKKEIVSELEQLVDLYDVEEAVDQAKILQDKFRSIGYVPIKKKNKIEKEYKEVCDKIYGRLRNSGRRKAVRSLDSGDEADKKVLRAEYFRLKKDCEKLQEEILRYKDTKTYINPGGKGNTLIEEIEKKIVRAQKVLDQKEEKLESLRRKVEQ